MSGHTKGPWFRIPGRSAVWSDENKSAVICGMHHNADNYEADANLIAAAPEMLEQLEKAALQFRYYENAHREKGT